MVALINECSAPSDGWNFQPRGGAWHLFQPLIFQMSSGGPGATQWRSSQGRNLMASASAQHPPQALSVQPSKALLLPARGNAPLNHTCSSFSPQGSKGAPSASRGASLLSAADSGCPPGRKAEGREKAAAGRGEGLPGGGPDGGVGCRAAQRQRGTAGHGGHGSRGLGSGAAARAELDWPLWRKNCNIHTV